MIFNIKHYYNQKLFSKVFCKAALENLYEGQRCSHHCNIDFQDQTKFSNQSPLGKGREFLLEVAVVRGFAEIAPFLIPNSECSTLYSFLYLNVKVYFENTLRCDILVLLCTRIKSKCYTFNI